MSGGNAMAYATWRRWAFASPSEETISLFRKEFRKCRTRSSNRLCVLTVWAICACTASEWTACSGGAKIRARLNTLHLHDFNQPPRQRASILLLYELCEDTLQVGQLHQCGQFARRSIRE